MSRLEDIDTAILDALSSVYEEIMWLAARPNTTPSAARAWYTHVASNVLRRRIRRFSGRVSTRAAIENAVNLRLEHFKRMQTTLTHLVARHLKSGVNDSSEFIRVVLDCEQVHIVTAGENYAAMKAKGDYDAAGISLLDWKDVAFERQRTLWRAVLSGRVANANDFSICSTTGVA